MAELGLDLRLLLSQLVNFRRSQIGMGNQFVASRIDTPEHDNSLLGRPFSCSSQHSSQRWQSPGMLPILCGCRKFIPGSLKQLWQIRLRGVKVGMKR